MVPVNLRRGRRRPRRQHGRARSCATWPPTSTTPPSRLEVISTSIRDTKEVFWQLPPVQQLALSALNVGGLFAGLIPGYLSAASPPFNIVISNVSAGRTEPLYWRGARLDGNYPLSIPLDGQAVNITVTNNADNLDFGLVGCRRSVPHLQRMLGHLETSLKELERAARRVEPVVAEPVSACGKPLLGSAGEPAIRYASRPSMSIVFRHRRCIPARPSCRLGRASMVQWSASACMSRMPREARGSSGLFGGRRYQVPESLTHTRMRCAAWS